MKHLNASRWRTKQEPTDRITLFDAHEVKLLAFRVCNTDPSDGETGWIVFLAGLQMHHQENKNPDPTFYCQSEEKPYW